MRMQLWPSVSSAGGNSACTFRRFSAVGGTATFGARQRSGLTLRSTGPATAGQLGPVGGTRYIFANRAKPSCRSGPVTSNVRPLNTPSSTFQHAFGHIAFKHLQLRCVKCGPFEKTGLQRASAKATEANLSGKGQCAPLRPRQSVLAFGCARVFKTSRTIQNATAGQSQSGSLAREAEVFRRSEANL